MLGKIVIPVVTTEEIDVSLLALNNAKSEMSTKYKTLQESGQLKINKLIMSLNLCNSNLQNILQEQARIDKEKTKIETEQKIIEQQICKANKELKELQDNPLENCPTCGAIMNEEKRKEHISKTAQEVENLLYKIPRIDESLDKKLNSLYDQEAELREKIESITLEIEKLDAENKSAIALYNAEINNIEEEIKEVQKKKDQTLKEQTEANSQKVNLSQQIQQLEQRKLTLVNQISQVNIDDKLVQLKNLEEKATVLNNQTIVLKDRTHLLEANKTVYEFWYVAFSNQGIRPLLLDKFVNSFNDVVRDYCYDVSGGQFVVQFTPTAKIRSGQERNKLGLEVIYKDKIVNYASLSGGEKCRVAIPLCFGLNKWVSSRFGIKNGLLGIMVLDELFANLDVQGRDSVAEMLNDQGKNRAIFCIDHSNVLAEYTEKIWNVSKIDECTQLEIV